MQNILSSKYVSHFLEQVADWQKKLATADQVITIWLEIQRTWLHLESIFIGSEDLRQQLPEDSSRFDVIDKTFRELLEETGHCKNVIEATNRPDLLSKLEGIQMELILCEKALAEYLDTKRLAFPRFYFISSADLLDILSNGAQPKLVSHFRSKIITEDVPIFMGLIGDLFPSLDVPRKRELDFEATVREACICMHVPFQVVQLAELLRVRHSVFIIGNALIHDLDPKAVTNDELFGVINRAT